jgi:benzoyl-CoA reductase subunit A
MLLDEYGKWPETVKRIDSSAGKGAVRLTLGVDVGTTSTQAVAMAEKELVGYASIASGYDFAETAKAAVRKLLGDSGATMEDFSAVAATGFGRRNVAGAGKTINEIQCHAIGARFLFGPKVTTVVDLGAQNVIAIKLHKWDRVMKFELSDKCAAGMGRAIEVICDLLHIQITEIGEKSLSVEKDPEPVSTTCSNFAYPETVGLFRPGYREDAYTGNDVLAAFLFTHTWRILSTVGKLCPLDIGDIRVEPELGFTGGLAKNPGITKRLERELGCEALKSETDPILAGAIGAAILA